MIETVLAYLRRLLDDSFESEIAEELACYEPKRNEDRALVWVDKYGRQLDAIPSSSLEEQ